jgi:predicted transcriptional regulator
MPKPKGATSVRLSEEAQQLLEALAEKYQISKTAVLELAIREKAKRDGVKPKAGA